MTGTFITFEGGEGSGKSTQLELLQRAFAAASLPSIKTREPGGSPGAERIRELLVTGNTDAWDPMAETLLFYAARLDHVQRIIKPALAEGKTVLCDRFSDSTIVYQGAGKNIPEATIRQLHTLTLGDFMPHLTVILDIDPILGLKRAGERRGHETRFENMNLTFHQNVRAGFLAIANREPKRCAVVDASQDIAALHRQIVAILHGRLGIKL